MVQFTLPKNSKVGEGKTWPHPAKAKAEQEFRIYRWNPDEGANPRIDTYYVDTGDCGPMVLDALIWIKNNIDPTLTFRRSCREGICGSCAMNIDGINTLACTKAMSDMSGAGPHLSAAAHAGGQGSGARPHQFLCPVRLDQAVAADGFADAAEGMEAEPRRPRRSSTASTNAFSAPAARPHARAIGGTRIAISARRRCCRHSAGSWTRATRPTGERLDDLEDPFRLYRCHTIMNCAKACPKHLNPAKAIAEIKRTLVERQV